ncbi:MaoC family dehydratase [Alicycliphilus denitrificans]|nr:MaoC family dehydratase [Alicycliphilus denitrificans]
MGTHDEANLPFDPRSHRMCAQKYFDDFELGERFVLPSRTMTDALFAAFQLASGDNHPIHYDVEYCRAHGMPHMLAHGYQVLIQAAAGAGLFPHVTEDSMKGFIEQQSRFLAPVYVGDTLYGTLVVSDLRPGRTTGVITLGIEIRNQNGVLVMDGSQKYLLKRSSTAIEH